TVANYEILAELGRGGMGVVYKARQISLNRPVALKMILAGRHAASKDLERFRQEAEAVARLRHPNIIQIYDIGEAEGRPFFALEFVAALRLPCASGRQVASSSWDKTIKIWDSTTGAVLHELRGHTDKVQSVAYDPEG